MIPTGTAKAMSSLSWDMVQKKGLLQIPLSGVVHIKANGKVPVTMSMICDNVLNAWKMQVKGVACTMDSLAAGWSDLDEMSEQLRSKLENKAWKASEHTLEVDVDDDDTCDKKKNGNRYVEWEDALPILTL
jgi:hypothetical protein